MEGGSLSPYAAHGLPMEGQQKEIQYPGWLGGTTRKGLWSGVSYEVSKGNRCLKKYKLRNSGQYQHDESSVL